VESNWRELIGAPDYLGVLPLLVSTAQSVHYGLVIDSARCAWETDEDRYLPIVKAY